MTTPLDLLFLRASQALTRDDARKVLADAKKLRRHHFLSTTDKSDETICQQ